ncbi:MAG TPA: molybdenum cofactor biosynthesis protein MoaE, partial [Candidatus Eisenbacteria bacterium]|nr:molybdenum cofactor biosynthesis protein MoaE [Candidatus Eisenbacteria bacterium]
MRVDVVFFAALRESAGTSRTQVELPDGARGSDLRALLIQLRPSLADLIRASRLAQGVDFIDEERLLTDGEEIVLIPPVSGGSGPPAVLLTHAALDVLALRDAANRPGAGAVVVFEGVARSPSMGKDVLRLEYEAYEPMARAQMERIVEEARSRWPITAAFLHHRLGRIEVGETSVIALASSPHRAEAFEACRHLIER